MLKSCDCIFVVYTSATMKYTNCIFVMQIWWGGGKGTTDGNKIGGGRAKKRKWGENKKERREGKKGERAER